MKLNEIANFLEQNNVQYNFYGLHKLTASKTFNILGLPPITIEILKFREEVKTSYNHFDYDLTVKLLNDSSFNIDNKTTLSRIIKKWDKLGEFGLNTGCIFEEFKFPKEMPDDTVYDNLIKYIEQLNNFEKWMSRMNKLLKIQMIANKEFEDETN